MNVDINLDKNRFFAKHGNMNLTTPWTDRAQKIRFNIGETASIICTHSEI